MQYADEYEGVVIHPTPKENSLIIISKAKLWRPGDGVPLDLFRTVPEYRTDDGFEVGWGFVEFTSHYVGTDYTNLAGKHHRQGYFCPDLRYVKVDNVNGLSEDAVRLRRLTLLFNLRASRSKTNIIERRDLPVMYVDCLEERVLVAVRDEFLSKYFKGEVTFEPNVPEDEPEKVKELKASYDRWEAHYPDTDDEQELAQLDQGELDRIVGTAVAFVNRNQDYGFSFDDLRAFAQSLIDKASKDEKYGLAQKIQSDNMGILEMQVSDLPDSNR